MAAYQAPPSLGFSRQEHWSGLPFPSPMHESEKWPLNPQNVCKGFLREKAIHDQWQPGRTSPSIPPLVVLSQLSYVITFTVWITFWRCQKEKLITNWKKLNGVVLLYASEQEYWRKNQVWIKEKTFILDEKTFLTVVGVIAQWNSLPRRATEDEVVATLTKEIR